MIRKLQAYLKPVLICVLIFGALMTLNMVLQLGFHLSRIHPALEWVFYGAMLVLACWGVVMPLFKVMKAKTQMKLDLDRDFSGADLEMIENEIARLDSLPHEVFKDVNTELKGADKLKYGYEILDEGGSKIVLEYSKNVFFSTAISQNGKLDAIFVLANQFRMINAIVAHYGLKPTIEELIKLYSNVFISVLGAEAISEAEITTIVTKVSTSSSISNIPGLSGFANILTKSLLEGTGNALLTLRTGFIALGYLDIEKVERKKLSGNATFRALKHLPALMQDVALAIAGILGKSAWNTVKSTGEAVVGAASSAGEAVVDAASSAGNTVKETLNDAVDMISHVTDQTADSINKLVKKAPFFGSQEDKQDKA